MSKEEDLSRQYVMPFLDKQYAKYGEHKQMELSRFDGYDMMSAYEEGYHQAEKDLELGWDDISELNCLLNEVEKEFKKDMHEDKSYKGYCQEVLKRFNEQRKEK